MSVNASTVTALMKICRDDTEMTDLIIHALESFENYHQAIYRMELRLKLYACGTMDGETYRETIPSMDAARTRNHNALLSEVKLLNRLAEQNGLPAFYEGTVSEERPFRTEVADAVLEFVRNVIVNRAAGGNCR